MASALVIGLEALSVPSLEALLALGRPQHVVPPYSLLLVAPVFEQAGGITELAALSLIFTYGTLAHYVA